MKSTMWNYLPIAMTAIALSTASVTVVQAQEDTALQKCMQEVGDAFKKLHRAMRAPNAADLADYQAQVAIVKKNAIKAKSLVPMLAEEAGDQKATIVAAYQKSMTEFIGKVEKLEKALAAGDLTQAQTLVGELNDARKKGHKEFQKPEEE